MKRKIIPILIFLLLIIVPVAFARTGVGITGCNKVDTEGKCIHELVQNISEIQTYTYNVYNFDNTTKTFFITISGELENRSIIQPKEFELGMHDKGICETSPGCQTVTVHINTSGLKQENYTATITATSVASTEGALQINQVLNSRLLIEVPKQKVYWGLRSFLTVLFTLLVILIGTIWLLRRRNNAESVLDKYSKKEKINKNKKAKIKE